MSDFEVISQKAIKYLKSSGFEAYVVGGFVRNTLMGLPVSDIDICTNALPEEIGRVFTEFNVYETGIKHGTVTVIIDKTPVEITTYRIDGEYKNHRKPDEVLFTTSIYEDLSRRDFTINAMAFDENQNILDLFDGREDLKNNIIRCVGNSEKRFEEDALRILRALRFSSVLGFDVEDTTKKAIFSKFKLLSFVSKERITEEILKLFGGKHAKIILKEFSEIFEYLSGGKISEKLYLEKNDPLILLSFFEKTDFLRLSASDSKIIKFIKENCHKTIISDYDILSLLNCGGVDATEKIMLLSKNCHLLKTFYKLAENGCYFEKHLAVSGNDILKLGYNGKDVGKILNSILNLVMQGEISNKYEVLMDFIKKNKFFALFCLHY